MSATQATAHSTMPPMHRMHRMRRGLELWLAFVCVLVVSMVVIGGITRLTGSGLSIVEWKPVVGALPPLSEAEWSQEFAKYQGSPQFRLQNVDLTLEGFKRIFFWEYVHRLLGRFIGVAFAVPFAYFTAKKAIPRLLSRRLLVAFALGGLQGALGWFMVKSGLVDVPHVSHYRLAAHLALALTTLAVLFWVLLDVRGERAAASRAVRSTLLAALVLLALQIVYGAFTAGLHAGIGYNTFPTMYGRWVPVEALAMSPLWRNAVENSASVQFIHRLLGTILVVVIGALNVLARREPRPVRRAAAALAVVTLVQYGLGVATLLLIVPITLAVVHQLGACVLFVLALAAIHQAREPSAVQNGKT